ncbi:hypothetical protein I2I05_19110 [Hymenobacter sp. BT683]|uniref:Uncharacterized protein n=1 Tax=Hymenobacter jeongseonensis TaxID=2791027 RepID=A0ABS0IME2_9BACT|nr:hypothetical protein [Hymenobacter jeongseonensis]MBF9239511.1 hypothetical protein [Hymenobacter jeongseonensis]
MNYIYWNKLVADFLFTPSRKNQEVFLYLTEDDIVQALKKAAAGSGTQELVRRMAEWEEGDILSDFWKALREGPLFWRCPPNRAHQDYWVGENGRSKRQSRPAPTNPAQCATYALADWRRAPASSTNTSSRKFYHEQGALAQTTPLHLLYLACFTMPFSMADATQLNAGFYEIWRAFFLSKGLISGGHHFPDNSLTQLNSNWAAMWEELARWSQEELGSERGILRARQLGGYSYVGWPQSQCLLPPTALNQLPRFFAYHHLMPGSRIAAGELRQLLLQGPLVLPAATLRELRTDTVLGQALTDIVSRKLQAWSGSTGYRERRTVIRNGVPRVEEITLRGNTYGTLLPFLPIDLAESEMVSWSYRLSIRAPLPENLTITVPGQPPVAVQPTSAEWSCAIPGVLPSPILQEFTDAHNGWTLSAKLLPLQVFAPGGRYGFYQYWAPIPALEHGTELLVLCERELASGVRQLAQCANAFQDWSNFAGLPANYSLFWLSNLPANTYSFIGAPVAIETYIRAQGGLDCGFRSFLRSLPPSFRLINGAVGQQLGCTLLNIGQTAELLPDNRAPHDQSGWILPADLPSGQPFRITGIGKAELQTLPFKLQEPALPTSYQVPLRGPRGEVASPEETLVYNGTCLSGHIGQLHQLHLRNGGVQPQFEPVIPFGHLAPPATAFTQDNFGDSPNDLLLHYLSSVSKLTNQAFGEALQTIHDARRLSCPAPARYPTPTTADRQAAFRLYSQLGFGDYDSLAGTIQVLPPALLRLPIAGSAGRRMLLTGARTPQLLLQLRSAAEAHGVLLTINSQFNGESIWNSLSDPETTISSATTQAFRQLLPNRVELLAHGHPTQGYGDDKLKGLAAQCGIQFCGDMISADLLQFSGSLIEYQQALAPYTEELPTDWKQSWFDPQTLKWYPGAGDRAFCLTEYEYRVYRRQCFLWQDGIPYAVDKSWGRYLVLQQANQQVLHYNHTRQLLKVPAAAPFPEIPARAVALLSGYAPALEWDTREKRLYNVYQTGNTYTLLHSRLYSVLGQRLHETL